MMSTAAASTRRRSSCSLPPLLLLLSLALSSSFAALVDKNSNAWHARFPTRGWMWGGREFSGMLAGEEVETKLCDSSVASQAGYFKISGSKDKNYFYWFFESRSEPSTDPVLIWLTGGPGCSSILALLTENGPCLVNEDGTDTVNNPYSWTNKANVIWVDQPAGVGFSYQSAQDNLTDTEEEVAEDLYHFLQAFYTANPQFVTNDFYVFGESYGGHFVPAVGHKIFTANKANKGQAIPINLKGLGIGNGFTDPEIQYQYYAEYARNNSYGVEIVSEETAAKMESALPRCVTLIKSCQSWETEAPCVLARMFCSKYIMGYFPLDELNVYDIRRPCDDPPLCYNFDHVEKYLNTPAVQEALHVRKEVGNDRGHWTVCNDDINIEFSGDAMRDYHTLLVPLLESGVKVLNYAGDADFICNHLGVEGWSHALEWEGGEAFRATNATVWMTADGVQGGEIRSAQGFTYLRMYESGHMCPQDQPAVSAEMLVGWMGVDEEAKERWDAAVLASQMGGKGEAEVVEVEVVA